MSEQEDEKRTEMGVKAGEVGRGRERRAGRAEKDDERRASLREEVCEAQCCMQDRRKKTGWEREFEACARAISKRREPEALECA
eukprot:3293554-Pleurochrysis_carterae.AAC.1